MSGSSGGDIWWSVVTQVAVTNTGRHPQGTKAALTHCSTQLRRRQRPHQRCASLPLQQQQQQHIGLRQRDNCFC
ncbi:hypothetical protein E2C01_032307 [Portunus trituberculatus]|uniref:Uncharacterized protein n=1 Tax=Portunus trituberculatus TaxID=210409 RepID=A0A5B7EVP1_PORTR|nr:hypothetical protein [Portunus trituberculatus]